MPRSRDGAAARHQRNGEPLMILVSVHGAQHLPVVTAQDRREGSSLGGQGNFIEMAASPEIQEIAVITGASTGMGAATARELALSPNTVKSYIRTIYRKIDVGSRTQAVLWGVKHGFTPDHHRIEHWRGGP